MDVFAERLLIWIMDCLHNGMPSDAADFRLGILLAKCVVPQQRSVITTHCLAVRRRPTVSLPDLAGGAPPSVATAVVASLLADLAAGRRLGLQ